MSYTLFLLLNVNHEKEPFLEYVGKKLEQTGATSFCQDQSPDSFFSVDYLQEGPDTSLVLDIPFGSEETVVKDVFDFMTYVEAYIQFQLLDPQLGRTIKPTETAEVFQKWQKLNREALKNYGDGHYFLRNIDEADGRKRMVEAIRFQEETWQNHCSVAMAYGRIRDAEEARKHFERALELDPGNSGIVHALGVTHFNLKDYNKAKEYLSMAVAQDSENDAARELLNDCEQQS